MPGFESCCLASRREIRMRLFSIVGISALALVATTLVDRFAPAKTSAVTTVSAGHGFGLDPNLGVGPSGEPPSPEDEVKAVQKEMLRDMEARP